MQKNEKDLNKTKYIFITGGVCSSLGKGLASASLGALLQARGYKVRLRKLDPYLNIDPGTMSPFQHGEVFVTDDGAETDLDLGHYERFTGVSARKSDNITAGQIYSNLLSKERKGDYLGGTVQVIPHVTSLIKKFITDSEFNDNLDFMLCEIGGTVGDIEALPFFEAIRQIGYEIGKDKCAFVHLTLLPYIPSAKELKTKPTQHSIKELRAIGIQPDVIMCRAEKKIDQSILDKIETMCSVRKGCAIAAPDVKNIYEVPITYHENGLDRVVMEHFQLKSEINLEKWLNIKNLINQPKKKITIAIIGKYTEYLDSYKSLLEAINHASLSLGIDVDINWVNSRKINEENIAKSLKDCVAILVPGGFGKEGTNGKIEVIKYARENKIPYFGICYGMQMAVIEYARNVAGIEDATSMEIDEKGSMVVGFMKMWSEEDKIKNRTQNDDLGGSMRLGSYPCYIKNNSLAHKIYESELIEERHRHRYEININHKEQLEKNGLVFSGLSKDSKLTEIIEIKDHPFFIGVQFHPELKSKPFAPHPLFLKFIEAAIKNT